jgi:hypothetical protein
LTTSVDVLNSERSYNGTKNPGIDDGGSRIRNVVDDASSSMEETFSRFIFVTWKVGYICIIIND